MKLTDEQRQKLNNFVQDKWKRPYACACCGANNWNLADEVYQLTSFAGGAMIIGGPIVPLVPVTCNNCGNTVLVNALIAEVVDQPKPEEAKNV